jgi:uncharacterized membrane protein
MVVAGFGAPSFMFLAGITMSLAAGRRQRSGLPDAEVAATARWRGAYILVLAFLFRAQSWLVSGGPPARMLKVDILNVMGVSMIAAALLWSVGRSRGTRAALLALAAAACAMFTPVIRDASMLSEGPDALVSYLRAVPGSGTFTLFPWAGFLLAGAGIGLWLDSVRSPDEERRVMMALVGVGLALGLGGYAASFLPSIYAHSDYWTSSPTYFFIRLGLLTLALPVAHAWNAALAGWSPLQDFGRSSLFVYWVHVELVYGVISTPLHGTLTFTWAVAGFVLSSTFMFLLVRAKDGVVARWAGRSRSHSGDFSTA